MWCTIGGRKGGQITICIYCGTRVRLIIDKDAPLVGSVDTSPLTSDIVDGLTQGLQKKLQQLKERQKQVEVELNKLRNEYEAKVNEVLKGVRRATAAYYYKKNKVEKQLKPDYDNACRPLFQRNEELIYKIELTSKQIDRIMRESGIQPREVGTTSYSVILESAGPKGPNVLDVIDALQEIIGEDDAWKLMRNIPSAFVHNLSMSDAERIKAKFEALGASARIMPASE